MTDLERMLITYLKNDVKEVNLIPIIKDYIEENKIEDDPFKELELYWMTFNGFSASRIENLTPPHLTKFDTEVERESFAGGLMQCNERWAIHLNLPFAPSLIIGDTKEEYEEKLRQEIDIFLHNTEE